MSIPKTKGYRTIIVSGQRFKWRFTGTLKVIPEEHSGREILEVDIGWFDRWLYINDNASMPSQFEPRVVTPSFVASAIVFGLQHGWDIERRGGKFVLIYRAELGFQAAQT